MNKVMLFVVLLVITGFIMIINFMNKNAQKPITPSLTSLSNPTATPTQPVIVTTERVASESSQVIAATTSAVIKTSKGNITLSFFIKDAPHTVANFIKKAKSGFYNGLTFHRVEDWVIQGGDPKGDGTGGGQMPTELNNKPFVLGSLGVARGGNIKVSNDAQFFITKTDASWLNGQYTNFGIVKSGIEVVHKIEKGDKIISIIVTP